MSGLEVFQTAAKGRGVRAIRRYLQGELLELTPVVVTPASEWPSIKATHINEYMFTWGSNHEDGGLALGLGSIFNHSFKPNARFTKLMSERMIRFVALRVIEPGEEVTVNYNGDPEDQTEIWFDVVD